MLRDETMLCFGTVTEPSRFSTSMQSIPRSPSSQASPSPTGPTARNDPGSRPVARSTRWRARSRCTCASTSRATRRSWCRTCRGQAVASTTNYLQERAAPEGLTILYGPWDPLAQALGDQTLRVRYDTFEYLGGTGDIRVNYARTDTVPGGIKVPRDS